MEGDVNKMALIKLTKNTTANNKEVVKKEKIEKKIKKDKKRKEV